MNDALKLRVRETSKEITLYVGCTVYRLLMITQLQGKFGDSSSEDSAGEIFTVVLNDYVSVATVHSYNSTTVVHDHSLS